MAKPDQQLIDVLRKIWRENIQSDYDSGLLVSESSLMAAFYYHVRQHLDLAGYLAFTEPTFWWNELATTTKTETSRHCKPDLVIRKEERIAAVVEFKYAPFDYPKFQGDLAKLGRMAQASQSYAAMINPATGRELAEKEQPRVTPDTILVYAVIGRVDSDACSNSFRAKIAAEMDSLRFHHFVGAIGADPQLPFWTSPRE